MNKPSLIDQFLNEQQELQTAVAEFSEIHDAGLPAQAKYYQKLIPMAKPGEGEQYAFEVNLDKCSGCKGCVTACHNLNGLDEEETWRDVGVIHGGSWQNPFSQTITTACHHCVEPGCMEGCPVLAYDKDPLTGIVKHLDDQCIGCQYCTFKCPYEVPKYSKKLGIVRKCDMCSSRLAVDEAPACVQACPTEAIRITIINQAEAIEKAQKGQFLQGAPDPGYTIPTTTYKTERDIPSNAISADHFSVQPEHAHMPLVFMLILTQLSIGVFTVDFIYSQIFRDAVGFLFPFKAAASLLLGVIALNAAILHLGRPLYAFRAIIGLRTSWMSREILAFAGFAKLAIGYAFVLWLPSLREQFEFLSIIPQGVETKLEIPFGIIVVLAGLGGVFCSGMIYSDTRRVFWRFNQTMGKFFGTSMVMGVIGTVMATAWIAYLKADAKMVFEVADKTLLPLIMALPVITLAKLFFEAEVLRNLKAGDNYLHRTALLLVGALRKPFLLRQIFGLVGGIALPILLLIIKYQVPVSYNGSTILALSSMSFLILLAGEFWERFLFFAAVVAPKMPGGFK